MTATWLRHPRQQHAAIWDSPIGEMRVVRPHKSRNYVVKHKGVQVSPTQHDTTLAAQQAAEAYVRERNPS